MEPTYQRVRDLPNWHKLPSAWFATFGGVGLLPIAPGTWGSLAATMVAYWMLISGVDTIELSALTLAAYIWGVMAVNRLDARGLGHDQGEYVIDEVVGQWLALMPLFMGMGDHGDTTPADIGVLISFGASFFIFRFFDILKPPPIRWMDKNIKGGQGVMLDDVAAGVASALTLALLLEFRWL